MGDDAIDNDDGQACCDWYEAPAHSTDTVTVGMQLGHTDAVCLGV